MNRLLQTIFILLIVASGCKKEKQPNDPVATDPSVPTINPPLVAVITELSPSTVTKGTLVTLKGINLGSSANEWTVYFQNKQATIRSVTSSEIKVVVPSTISGSVVIKRGGATVTTTSPFTFTYYDAFVIKPYTNGNVQLVTQAEVDAFVQVNKGRSLHIDGNLTIGLPADAINGISDIASVADLSGIINSVAGIISLNSLAIADAPFLNTISEAGGINISDSYFTSLSFNSLRTVTGDISLISLQRLTDLKFDQLLSAGNITLTSCPSIIDLSGFNRLEKAASVTLLSMSGVSTIAMDKLNAVTKGGIRLTLNPKLTRLSFRSLQSVTGSLQIIFSPQLADVDFTALKTVSQRLALKSTNLADMSGFRTVQRLGALNLTSNGSLIRLQGLEQLTDLDMPAINGVVRQTGGPGNAFTISGLAASLGGVTLESNTALISLAGLQNIKSLPVAYLVGNKVLNDLCPLNAQLTALANVPQHHYSYDDGTVTYDRVLGAVTLLNNGSYASTQEGLAALAICR